MSAQDVQRMVKCRVRSEVEARKAAESTMKRATSESFALKKELSLMRAEGTEREKVEKEAARKSSDAEKVRKVQRERIHALENIIGDERERHGTETSVLHEKMQCVQGRFDEQCKTVEEYNDKANSSHVKMKRVTYTLDEMRRKHASEVQELHALNGNLKAKCTKLNEKYTAAMSQVSGSKINRRVLKETQSQLHTLTQTVTSQLEEAKKEYAKETNEMMEERDELRAENQSLTHRIDQLEERIIESGRTSNKMVKETEEPEERSCCADLHDKLEKRDIKNGQLHLKNQTLKTTCDSITSKMEKLELELNKTVSELQDEKNARKDDHEALQSSTERSFRLETIHNEVQCQMDKVEASLQEQGISMSFLLKKSKGGSKRTTHSSRRK